MEQVRNCLLKSEKGGVVNNLQNSQFALENDPTLRGAIQKNLLSGQIEIVKPMIWRRNGLMLTDTDQSNIELFLERYYGLTNQRKIATAVSIVANEHQYHPIRDYRPVLTCFVPFRLSAGWGIGWDITPSPGC